jgi:hypothetical protein
VPRSRPPAFRPKALKSPFHRIELNWSTLSMEQSFWELMRSSLDRHHLKAKPEATRHSYLQLWNWCDLIWSFFRDPFHSR